MSTRRLTASATRSTPRAHTTNVHTIWHRIAPRIEPYLTQSNQHSKLQLDALMARYQQRYPTEIFHATCDDDFFSSASLYFILHRAGRQFMGTTVIFVSQCDTQVPTRFFLYPSHVQSVQTALRACQQAFVGSTEWHQARRIQRLIATQRRKASPQTTRPTTPRTGAASRPNSR